MSIKLKTAPAVEPISLSEAKAYLRITDSNDDAFISALISAVRQRCEEYTQRALITQTWSLWMDAIPVYRDARMNGIIELPRPPLQSVTLLNSYLPDNSPIVFSATNYMVDTVSEPGRICLNQGAVWPVQGRAFNAFEIEYVAGYGSTSISIPEDLKQGMFLLLKILFSDKSKMFETDESRSLAGQNDKFLPEIVKGLWNTYRVMHL